MTTRRTDRLKTLVAAAAAIFLGGAALAGENYPQYFPSDVIENAPFSEAVIIGDMLYLSGQIGSTGKGQLISGGITAEARQTMENIKATVEKHGSSMDRVVKCTVFLADISEWVVPNACWQ